MEHIAKPFSIPLNVDEALFHTIICVHAKANTNLFLEKHANTICAATNGLKNYIETWLEQPISKRCARTYWDSSFGQVNLALRDRRVDIIDTAIRIGLRISENRHYGSWSAQAITPRSFTFARSIFEEAVYFDYQYSETAELQVTTSNNQYNVPSSKTGWQIKNVEQLRSVDSNKNIALFSNNALPLGPGTEFFNECKSINVITDEIQQTFKDGYTLLEVISPEYSHWVTRVLSAIVVGSLQPPFKSVSGSWEEAPGYVHISYPHAPIDISEILVHESAHQYFYLLERLGPVDDGSDTNLYYSPPIRTNRPLSRILMAYHALANVWLLYQQTKSSNIDDGGYVAANESELVEALKILDKPLNGNSALTEIGRGLYLPLANKLSL